MRLLICTLALAAGCSKPVVEGTLTNDSGQPLAGVSVAIVADEQVGLKCQRLGAETDESGHFRIEGPCLTATSYSVKTNDDALWLSEGATIPIGNTAPVKVVAIRTGGREGVYLASGESVVSLKTGADIRESVFGDAPVRFLLKSKNVQVIAEKDKVLLNGAEAHDKYAFHTVTWTPGPLTMGPADAQLIVPDGSGIWLIDGIIENGALKPLAAVVPDAGKVRTHTSGDVRLSWVGTDALPASRYALFREEDRRPYLLDFGKSFE